jgi:predicted regulator of Ras-like GTPase activity (Roadblock/LC7/MglB family)
MNMGAVDHNLVTTNQAYVITRFLGDNSYYWGLAITKDAVLGLAYILMDDYAERIWEAIPR